tara:strand:+ start:235 stop:411 length:177 start_codon:yes stop_codon:yes gene_type:complete
MDWELETKLNKMESMIHVYEEHIVLLEKEKKQLQAENNFLKEQLKYKTFGKPVFEEEN